MNASQYTPWIVAIGVLSLLIIWLFVRGARRRAEKATRVVTRMGGNFGRALVTTVVIGGVQWLVLAHTTDPRTWAAVLGFPALFAAAQLVRMFASTHEVAAKSKGGHR